MTALLNYCEKAKVQWCGTIYTKWRNTLGLSAGVHCELTLLPQYVPVIVYCFPHLQHSILLCCVY